MKKNIMMTLLCLLAIETRAADYAYLVFTTADGNQQAVTATDLTITFSDGTLIATDGSQTLASIAVSDLVSMEFSNTDTGIQTVIANSLITDDGTVVYDMSGRQMPQGAALPKGVYIVKNSNRTFKMQIK